MRRGKHPSIERPEDEDQDPEVSGQQAFAAMLDAFERGHTSAASERPKVGDKVSARIIGFGEETAFIDLGGKAEGVIPLVELTDDDGQRTVEVGDTVEGSVVSVEDDVVVLRVRGGRGPVVPAELLQAHTHGLPVEGTVTAVVKGGVEVTVGGIRAFCPISQLDARFVEDAAGYVGQRLAFRVSRYEEGRGRGPNVVLNRRVLLEQEAAMRAAEARARIEVGKVLRGTVTSLASYGAFVDLGGLEGLLHVSELGHGRVGHPQEVVAVGQELEVQVQKIATDDKGRERISLSRRALLKDPWNDTVSGLHTGQRCHGKVAKLESFGAFVEIAPGVDGLLHLSELEAAGGRELKHARDALRVGQAIEVSILAVDLERRRISLALARAGAEAEAEAAQHRPAEAGGFGALGDFLKPRG